MCFGIASSLWCVTTARELGATFDEPTYLTNGMHFWHTGSHRTLMRLGTMPLPVDVQTFPLAVAEWLTGKAWNLETDFRSALIWMRHGNLVFWWLLLIFAFRIARDIGGPWAGRLAVAAIACEPNLLAHASLATTDIAITATTLGYAYYFAKYRESNWARRVGLAGFWYGFALLSKASAMVFVPLISLTTEFWRLRQLGRWPGRPFIRDMIGICLLGFVIALIGVGSDFQVEASFIKWANSLPAGTSCDVWLWIAEHLCVFGNAAEGLVMQIKHNFQGHGQFLLGHESEKPFWYFYPVLFAIKSTVAVLIAFAIAPLCRSWWRGNWPLICGSALLLFSLTCRVQIGIRLQLPALAFCVIGLSSAISRATANRHLATICAWCGVASMAAASVCVWPNGLSYVNELWGGTANGYRLVSDSNYDWGQGLPELLKWKQSHGNVPLDVWYYGVDPELKTMPFRDAKLHCMPLKRPGDTAHYIQNRFLAVATTLRFGHVINPAHGIAVEYLSAFEPVDRTTTFLIYDMDRIKNGRSE